MLEAIYNIFCSMCYLMLLFTYAYIFLINLQQVRRQFRPELLNRLDEIVVFDPLSHDQLRKVARLQMKDVASRLAEKGIALAVTDAALDYILAESYDPVGIIMTSLFSIRCNKSL